MYIWFMRHDKLYIDIMKLWLRLRVCDELSICWIIRYMCIKILYALICELWNVQSHNCKPFKGDEYCDRIHCENLTSLITLMCNKLKLVWEQLKSFVFYIVHRKSLLIKIFSGLDLNQEGEVLTDSWESRAWG